ncbi:MAG: hypothetical protein ACI4JK_04235 [Oscillospiraceae bacterium]
MRYTGKMLTVFLTSLLAATVVLCSCNNKGSDGTTTVPETSFSSETTVNSTDDTSVPKIMLGAVTPGDQTDPDAFSSYTFSLNGGENNYMITVSATDNDSELKIITEDSSFNYSEYIITAPENYILDIPYSQEYASSVCSVLTNTADDQVVPDVVQFLFYLDNFDTEEELPYTVKRLYSVKNGEFTELKVYDADGNKMDYIPEYTLLRTEGTVFMPTPTVTFDDNGTASVDLTVYDFDTNGFTLKKRVQSADFETDKLYYGYAAKAVADDIAKYFTTTSLNVSDYENYVQLDSLNSDGTSFMFYFVDDPRFKTVSELESFVKKYFDAKTTSEMFINAPQRYRDVDGKLCTVVGDAGIPYIGNITITGYNYNEKAGTITYKTKAERFDEEGKFVEFIDGGDFALEVNTNDQSFRITQYKLNY